jgi:hypothetical protein
MRRILFTTLFFLALAMSLMQAKASNRAELHWSVCEASPDLILKKLGLQVKEIEQRSVSYHDTWSEPLGAFENYSEGRVLRIRNDEDGAKSTVKLKFEEFPEVSEEWSSLEGFKCELDLNSQKESIFCSLSEEQNFFSDLQKKFLREFSREPDWANLKEFGPGANRVWKFKQQVGSPKLELEELTLKDSSRIFELSTRSDLKSAAEDHLEISEWLLQKKIKICEVQESKTKQFLESYKSTSGAGTKL